MFKCECVYRRIKNKPYTTWRTKNQLQVSKQYRKLMNIIGKAIKAGKEVELNHIILTKEEREKEYNFGYRTIHKDDWYDKVIVTIK